MSTEKVVDKTNDQSTLRFERKFLFQNCHVQDVILSVLRNSYCFQEIFHRRKVNNIYFDDSNYNFYKQNVEGVAHRKKMRLRWYGDTTSKIQDPTIEVKKKMGEVGDKDSYPLKGVAFDLDMQKPTQIQDLLKEITTLKSGVYEALKTLHPTLINTYERRYFLSFCGRFRITVDFNQAFYNPNYMCLEHGQRKTSDIVLELKYALGSDHEARLLSQQIKTRLSKSSKYVNGINLLYHNALV
ncbi:polyphosphate polymerase domain-containing protein [Pareuzebyella sediminis]|uniref:polyphosphate polymerase domain-containing protein n=1 Tax=Pareuzebyella sediminis TaxID=2607998 RepID=UPI0018E12CF0|nr:polyphosphate polymerase domain-containing protein [Pareuzebyella sediminis]